MDAKSFFTLVEKMRSYQRQYFNPHTRTQRALNESRKLEALVDAEIKRVRGIVGYRPLTENTLFDNQQS